MNHPPEDGHAVGHPSRPATSFTLDQHGAPVPAPVPPGPPELLYPASTAAEVVFVLVCAAGQLVFTLTLGQVMVAQTALRNALGVAPSQAPWLAASSLVASGLTVVAAGALADLVPPKPMMVGAFAWAAAWNAVAAAAVARPRPPARAVLFFVARAMQGLSVGVLVSASMSILGRVYKLGLRKTRVFSLMAAGAPCGFWVGGMQGGALSPRPAWIFGSTALLLALLAAAAQVTLPTLRPLRDGPNGTPGPSLRQLDYLGASFAACGCAFLLVGLTQGPSAGWTPYTYTLIIVGLLMFVGFAWVERHAVRPLVPSGLWATPGLKPLMMSYFLGFGGFSKYRQRATKIGDMQLTRRFPGDGAWQFFVIQFWERYQARSPLTIGLYLLPNAVVGVLAVWIVSRTLHVLPGHFIFAASMVCFATGPAFSLPQTSTTSYWELSFVGISLATFGPDLSFAAAAIFITSSVPRSYQGAAGALLVTVQNLSSAVMTSASSSLGTKVDPLPSGEVGLNGLRAIWWFALASAGTGALITLAFVRIPKAEERDHIQ